MKNISLIILLLFLFVFTDISACTENPVLTDYKKMRESMVKNQIEARGISNKEILKAMLAVERHKFVDEKYKSQAYEDHPLPIGEGQTISQPYIVALMTDVLEPDASKKVLEIGTGSGYQAAVLAEIFQSVYTIELSDTLGEKAKKLLYDLGYKNIFVKTGDGYKGWKEHSPFDAIIVTCAPSHIPEPLKDQLKEGGIMVIPVGHFYSQELILLKKEKGVIKEKKIIPVVFVPMLDNHGKRY